MRIREFSAELASRLKVAYAVRNVDLTSPGLTLVDGCAPRPGHILAARVDAIGHHNWLELATGRKAAIYPGDEILLAFGERYAPDQYESRVPEVLSRERVVLAAGVRGEPRRPERGVQRLGGAARVEHRDAEAHGEDERGGGSGPGECQPTGRPRTFCRALCVDARAQAGRSLDLLRGAAREGDRQPLLREAVGELRRGSHLGLEGDAPVGPERPVGERRELGDLPIVGFVRSTTPQRHATEKGIGAGASSWRPGPGCAAGLVITP